MDTYDFVIIGAGPAGEAAANEARARGATFTREPGPHPDIAPDYYGAILLGPDGHKVEIVVE